MRIFALIACLSLATAANAQEASRWTGIYVGAHGGKAWSTVDGSMVYTDATPGDGFDASGKSLDGNGAIYGGQIGFNYQAGRMVFGIEADGSWAEIDGGERFLPYPVNWPANGSPAWDIDTSVDWLASIRARVGLTAGNTLVYATGGAAFAGIENRLNVVGPGYNGNGRKSEDVTGWTVGGGIEYALSRQWTIRAEYLYYRFDDVGGILPGTQTTSCKPACPHTTDGFGGDLELHAVRIGANHSF